MGESIFFKRIDQFFHEDMIGVALSHRCKKEQSGHYLYPKRKKNRNLFVLLNLFLNYGAAGIVDNPPQTETQHTLN